MKHLDLFSGIGGFALAADRVFGEVEHTFCEIDPFCQEVLKKHWPEAKIYGDIRTLTKTDIRESRPGIITESDGQKQFQLSSDFGIDILTGGFPCQPFSQAGRRQGTADDRYLWPEMLRVIREFHPSWVIGENVGGLVTWSEGLVLEQVHLDLENEGYEVQAFIIPAVAVNAPHRRDRVWIIAHSKKLDEKRLNSEGSGRRESKAEIGNGDSDASDSRRIGQEKQQQQAAGNQQYSWQTNWIEVATRLCGVFNGLSRGLDEIKLKPYATLANKITRQDLPCLWQAIQSEAFQWSAGRFNTVQHKDYLFTVLWKLTQKSEGQNDLPFESQEVQDAYMRNVWLEKQPGRSPQRQEYQEQYAKEHQDALSQLSHEVALATAEIWSWYSKDRNPRLKALGNAIVPQVAEEIFKAIKALQ